MRRFVLLFVVATLPACSLTSTRHTKSAIVADIAAAGAAALVLSAATCTPGASDPDEFELFDECFGRAIVALYVGVPLAIVAAGFGVYAVAGIGDDPGNAAPATDPLELSLAGVPASHTICPVAAVTPIGEMRLPERRTKGGVLMLAHRARRAALAGDRLQLRELLSEIADRDAAYHADLLEVAIIARCLSD